MDIVFLIGGGFFVFNAFNHFTKVTPMSAYAKSKGTPAPAAAVVGSGIFLLLGGLSEIFGVYPFAGGILLIIFLVGVCFKMHDFWAEQDPQRRMYQRIHFTKNIVLLSCDVDRDSRSMAAEPRDRLRLEEGRLALIALGKQIDGGMNGEAVLASLVGTVQRESACDFSLSQSPRELFAEVVRVQECLIDSVESHLRQQPAPQIAELIRKLR